MTQASVWPLGSNPSGLNKRLNDNLNFDAVATLHKGPTPPTYASSAGFLWCDDSADPVWIWRQFLGGAAGVLANWKTLFSFNRSSAELGLGLARLQLTSGSGAFSIQPVTGGNGVRFIQEGVGEFGRFSSAGDWLVGKTEGTFAQVGCALGAAGAGIFTRSNGQSLTLNRLDSDGQIAVFYRQSVGVGSIAVTATSTSFNQTSDARLKTSITEAPSQIGWIKSIRIREYEYNADPGRKHVGVIAQEHILVSPDAITRGDDGIDVVEPWGNDPSKDVYRLLKVCQEQQSLIEELENRLSVLEAAE